MFLDALKRKLPIALSVLTISLFTTHITRARGIFPALTPSLEDTGGEWFLTKIKADTIVKKLSCGRGTFVVLIDSGVETDHPDLKNHLRLDLAYDFGDNDTDVTDLLGHGTATAGLVAKIAPCAQIIPLKINPEGADYFEDEALIRALNYTLRLVRSIKGNWIVNMSLSVATPSEEITGLIHQLRQEGAILVGASGNEGKENTIDYPASLPEVLAISSTTNTDTPYPESNCGRQTFISAPGEDLSVPWLNGSHTTLSGTSLSAALVSGTIAILKELGDKHPDLSLAQGSDDIEEPGWDTCTGFGRLNIEESILSYLSKDLPVFPSHLNLSPGETTAVFFAPDSYLRVLNQNEEKTEIVGFNPQKGLLILTPISTGENRLYLYALNDLYKASRIEINSTSDSEGYLDILIYPRVLSSNGKLCVDLHPESKNIHHLTLTLTYSQTGSFVKQTLWEGNFTLRTDPLITCIPVTLFSFTSGIQELLLCGDHLPCSRTIFTVE